MPYTAPDRVAELEAEIENLKWQLAELLGTDLLNPIPALNGVKFRMVNLMANRAPNIVLYEGLCVAISPSVLAEPMHSNTLKVHMVRIRQALKPYGIEVETIWGRGYRMTVENATKWQALLDQSNQEAAA